MTTITLSNHNPLSKCRKATINLATSKCSLAENQDIERMQLMHDRDFIHPLLTHPTIDSSSDLFHYEYDDIQGLLHSAIYVYSTLLNAVNPHLCQFKIKPSAAFQPVNATENVYFSIHSHQFAQESIHMSQLEALVSHLSGDAFKFIDQLLIDEELTMKDLPSSINGDLLFEADKTLVKRIHEPCALNGFELRYINPNIGFGLFCREGVKKDDILFFYAGKKSIHDNKNEKYAFEHRLDCLNMDIDAQALGNIARFVNHAPNPIAHRQPAFLDANLQSTSHYLHGIEIIVFSAIRDIQPGEQLLVDYGKKFFKTMPISRFSNNNKMTLYDKILKRNSTQTTAELRIMASHGVQRAERYLLFRVLVIVGIISLAMAVVAKF